MSDQSNGKGGKGQNLLKILFSNSSTHSFNLTFSPLKLLFLLSRRSGSGSEAEVGREEEVEDEQEPEGEDLGSDVSCCLVPLFSSSYQEF